MIHRRRFLKKVFWGMQLAFWGGMGLARRTWGQVKKEILPPDTDGTSLAGYDPKEVDAGRLAVTPIEDFDVMGQTKYQVDLSTWRLKITGAVEQDLALNYQDLLARPTFEKKVLLICPGVFSYVGLWKGISLQKILRDAGLKPGAGQIEVFGPGDANRKREVFKLNELADEQVFLAMGVNGQTLPEKHGYPVRLVAGHRYGDDWVKYIGEIKVS